MWNKYTNIKKYINDAHWKPFHPYYNKEHIIGTSLFSFFFTNAKDKTIRKKSFFFLSSPSYAPISRSYSAYLLLSNLLCLFILLLPLLVLFYPRNNSIRCVWWYENLSLNPTPSPPPHPLGIKWQKTKHLTWSFTSVSHCRWISSNITPV